MRSACSLDVLLTLLDSTTTIVAGAGRVASVGTVQTARLTLAASMQRPLVRARALVGSS
jgi:hypothetical protein